MQTPTTPGFQSGVDYERFLECVHCGLCTASCPTYLELGTEMDGPRGRIHLMRAVTDGRAELDDAVERHLELCLDCRSCETACPSGVQYGRIIEPFRVAMHQKGTKDGWLRRMLLFHLFPYPDRMRWSLLPVRFMQATRIDRLIDGSGLLRLLPTWFRQMHAMVPPLPRREPPLPSRLEAKGNRRAVVALLTGCVADAMFHHTNWATARVLQENGCDVVIPAGQTCCGAIHYHAGAEGPAIERAVANARAVDPDAVDAIIVNVAGCGAMLKEYDHLAVPESERSRVRAFARKVRDINEFLVELGPVAPKGRLDLVGTYHDACHLVHAQRVRSAPRQLLRMIPGLKLIPLDESDICCGAAGTYNLTQPEMAERLVKRKTANLSKTGAQAVFIANAGCSLHIGRRLRQEGQSVWIAHPVEALDCSYRNILPPIPSTAS